RPCRVRRSAAQLERVERSPSRSANARRRGGETMDRKFQSPRMEHRRSNGGIRKSVMSSKRRLPIFCLLSFAFCLLSLDLNPLATARGTVLDLNPLATARGAVVAQSADAWPQFRGNYNNTGVSPSQPPADLKLLWTYDAGDIIESSAAIAAGTVYVGTGKSELIAVDLQTGKLKWSYKTPEAIRESS